MRTQRLVIALTVVNLLILSFTLTGMRQAVAAQGVAPVLRGRSLEIVDDQGRVRVTLNVRPGRPSEDGGTRRTEAITQKLCCSV
jgi:hypothetical protein